MAREAKFKKQRVFNTVQLNSVRPRVNTVNSTFNTVRSRQPVPTRTSNSFSPKRPQGKRGTAVKTSAGYNWRNSNPNSNCDSGPTFIRTDHPLKNMVDRGIFDSGCSGHMTGNKDQLEDFEEFNGGSVTFGGSKGYISIKGKIRFGNLDFDSMSFVKELGHFNLFSISQICDKQHKVPRHHNMYSFDMKTPTPAKSFACLIAKATSDESKMWHRRLGHINFKNLNKLVKGNLVRDTLSMLGKFDGKSEEGFLVEDKPNVKGVGYRWMFDIDYLTDSVNYIPVLHKLLILMLPRKKNEDAELIIVPSAVKNTEEKVDTRKSSTNSKKEEILTEPLHEKDTKQKK
ncbi:ribonuclease H-like domain-containing protein [Tanacetum coccineum]